MLQLFGKLFLVAVAVNFPWEMAQAYLYAPMGDSISATMRCFRATIVDAGIVLGMAVAGTAVFGTDDWFRRLTAARALFPVAAGASIALLIEHFALSAGRWHYRPLMPLIPWTDIGVVPVVQMTVLPLLIFRLVARSLR